jgi:hypothetical protein
MGKDQRGRMRTIVTVMLLIALCAGAGYYVLPIVIEKETQALRNDLQEVKQRLDKMEAFVRDEEESRKVARLKPDADVRKIIEAVNALSLRLASLEEFSKKGVVRTDGEIKKQAERLEKQGGETAAQLRAISFDAAVTDIRGHILKARMDIANKNLGTVKTDLELLNDAFEGAKSVADAREKKGIGELQDAVRKAQGEIDSDLPAAIHRIDLVWYELGKLLRKH